MRTITHTTSCREEEYFHWKSIHAAALVDKPDVMQTFSCSLFKGKHAAPTWPIASCVSCDLTIFCNIWLMLMGTIMGCASLQLVTAFANSLVFPGSLGFSSGSCGGEGVNAALLILASEWISGFRKTVQHINPLFPEQHKKITVEWTDGSAYF